MYEQLIIAASTVAAVLISVVTVVMAARSASAAQKSAEVAAKILHRSTVRELISACHELLAEELRVQSLGADLRMELQTLFGFSKTTGGSAEQELLKNLKADLEVASENSKEAHKLANDPGGLITASDNDLDQKNARIETARIVVQNIREKMARDLENIRAKNAEHREQRI